MALTPEVKTELYRFFSIAFNAAPGVTYMNQLAEAYDSGMTVPQIVEVFTSKPQFTAVYPKFLTNLEFATKLVNNVVGTSAGPEAIAEAITQVNEALGPTANWSRGKVIYQIFTNLAGKAGDATWGGTAAQLANKVVYAQYFTETLMRDTTDLATLQAAIANVTATSGITEAALAAALNPQSMIKSLTSGIDDLSANTFNSVPVYTPGGNDFINSLQDEDKLTGVGANARLNVTLGSVNDNAEGVVTPKLIDITRVDVEVTSGTANAVGINFQDSSSTSPAGALDVINVNRVTQSNAVVVFDDLPESANNLTIANATRGGNVTFAYREDTLQSTDASLAANTLAVGLDNARLSQLTLNQGTDGGAGSVEDNDYFFETVAITSTGSTNIDRLNVQANNREDVSAANADQVVSIVANGALEINNLQVPGAERISIVANAAVVIAADEVQVLRGTNDGITSGQLRSLTISGPGNVTIDGVDAHFSTENAAGTQVLDATGDAGGGLANSAEPLTVQIDASGLAGNLTLSVAAATDSEEYVDSNTSLAGNDRNAIDGLDIRIQSGGGNDRIETYTALAGAISTGAGNDTVSINTGADNANGVDNTGETYADMAGVATIDTGSGNDTVRANDMRATADLEGARNSSYSEARAASIVTGEGDDNVAVRDLLAAQDWNNGASLQSQADDTYLNKGASIDTGAGNDTVSFRSAADGASIQLGAGTDTINVTLSSAAVVLLADDGAAAERSADGTANAVGAVADLGEGSGQSANFTEIDTLADTVAAAPVETTLAAFTIVGADAELRAGAGTDDVLNVTALDSVVVASPTVASDLNATIIGFETVNLTVANQIIDDTDDTSSVNAALSVNANDMNDGDGQISIDVARVNSALSNLNLVSQERAMERNVAAETWQAGTRTDFVVNNLRSGITFSVTANEATGVSTAGALADDNQLSINGTTLVPTTSAAATDLRLTVSAAEGQLTDNTVVLRVNSGQVTQPAGGGMDLDITVNATPVPNRATVPTGGDATHQVERLAIVLNDALSHSINLRGFGDAQFPRPTNGDVSSTADTRFEVWSAATGTGTIALDGINADRIQFRNADGSAVTTANVVLRVDQPNNYNIETGSGNDIIDLRADDVRSDDTVTSLNRADTIAAGTGRDILVVSNGDSLGANNNIVNGIGNSSTVIDDDVFTTISGLEEIVTDADPSENPATAGTRVNQMITVDEAARATGVDTLKFVSSVAAVVHGNGASSPGVGAGITSSIVVGNNFTAPAGRSLVIDAALHTGGQTLLNIENKDDDTDTDEVNLDIRASATGGAQINLINSGAERSTVTMTVSTFAGVDPAAPAVSNVISATNAGNANGLVDINLPAAGSSFDTLVLLEGVGSTASQVESAVRDTVTISANWTRNDTTSTANAAANNRFEMNAGGLRDTDSNVSTGGLTVSVDAGDNAALTITTAANSDSVTGGTQSDTITTGLGNDTVNGGAGADVITAGPATGPAAVTIVAGVVTVGDADSVDGGSGNDTIVGGAGADTLIGGLGADSLDGGASDGASDVFVYTAVEQSVQSTSDTLVNFVPGTDKISITLNLTPAAGAAINLGRFMEVGNVGEGDNSLDGTTASARHMDAYYSRSGQLAIDVNGDGDITDVADIVINSTLVSETQGRITAGDINYTLTLGAGTTVRLGQGVDNITLSNGTNTVVVVGSLGATTDVVNYTNAGPTVVTSVANVRDVVQYNDLLTARGTAASEATAGDVINASAGANDTLHVYGTADFTNVTLIGIENVVINSNVTFTLDQFRSLAALTFAGTTPHAISVVVPDATGKPVAVPTAVVQQLIRGETIAVNAIPGVTLSAPVTSVAKTISATDPTSTVSLGGETVKVATAGGATTTFKYNGLVVDSNNIDKGTDANGLPKTGGLFGDGGATAVTNFVEKTFIANISGMNLFQLASIYDATYSSRYGFIQGTLNWTSTESDIGILNAQPGGIASNNTVSKIEGKGSANETIDLRSFTSKGFDVDPGAGNDTVYIKSEARDIIRLGSGGDDTLHVISGGSVARGGTVWGVTNADVVYGFAAGDTIKIGITPTGVTQSVNNIAGTGNVGFIRGTWSGNSFSEVVDGADTLLVWDTDGAGAGTVLTGVVLVGAGATVTGATGVTGGAGG